MAEQARQWFRGLPTAIDVRKLKEAFGTPKPGQFFSHEEMENVLGLDRKKDDRYQTVLTAWRRALFKEHNLDTAQDKGLRILTEAERVSAVVGDLGRGTRAFRRAAIRGSAINRDVLDEPQARRARMATDMAQDIFRRAADQFKPLAPPGPTTALPRPR